MARYDANCPLGQGCPLGLTERSVGTTDHDHQRLMHAVFGDGNGNEGLVATMQRREAQLSLLIWLFGPASIIGLLISAAALILQARGH